MKKISKVFLSFVLLGALSVTAMASEADQALFKAVKAKNYKAVQNLVEHKHANVNALDHSDTPLLLVASNAAYFDAKIFTYLVKHPKMNVNALNARGETALMVAGYTLGEKEISLLLKKGAKVNIKSQYEDWTAFLSAAQSGNVEVARLLKARGADIYATDANRNTALILASQNGHLEMVKYLVHLGINPDITNYNKKTAYDMASTSAVKTFLGNCRRNEKKVRKELEVYFKNYFQTHK